MKVQRIELFPNEYGYLLLDNENQVIESVHKYLRFLYRTNKAANTIKNYSYHLKIYFEYLQEIGIKYDEIFNCPDITGVELLINFIAWLRPSKNLLQAGLLFNSPTEGRSNSTINLIMTAVLGFYDFLGRTDGIKNLDVYKLQRNIPRFRSFLSELTNSKRNVQKSILKLRNIEPKLESISRDQFDMLFDACKSYRDKLLISIMFEGGFRLGESLGLHTDDLKVWDNDADIVYRKNLENGASVKNHAEGKISVPPNVMALYTSYLSLEFCDSSSEFVFINLRGPNKGKPMNSNTVERLFARLSIKVGFHVHPHMLRHGHASELYESGKYGIIEIKDRMRHRSINSTQRYIHLSLEYKRRKFDEFRQHINEKYHGKD